MPPSGFPVVLTADRSLMAGYSTLFEGTVAASQTTATPRPVLDLLIAPRVPSDGLRARQAPLGLRRVEAALVAGGFAPTDVAVVTPENLARAVGPDTRVVALSSGDPLGLGMNTSTMTAIAGGRSWTEALFQRLLAHVRALRRRFPRIRIVVGGPGAWQLAADARAPETLGIDLVLTGYCESQVAEVFRRVAESESRGHGGTGIPLGPSLGARPACPSEGRQECLPHPGAVVACEWTGLDHVPQIRGASVMGIVETSRGCGLGCDFCTLARVPMVHFPPEFVAADVATNLAAGVRNIALISEDLFRYGGTPARPNAPALLDLLRRLRGMAGLGMIQTDHGNITSVAGFSDAELSEVHALMCGDHPRPVWVNLGVETASGRLLASLPARAKMRPFGADEWPDACREQMLRLARAGFLPMASLVIGLEGETPDDVALTRRWVESFAGERVLVFPMLLAPTTSQARARRAVPLHGEHWRLFDACYRFNLAWVPRLLWSEQTAAGVSLPRRLALASMARANVPWWNMLLTLHW